MKSFLVSYITTTGVTVLNNLIKADSHADAIEIVKSEGLAIVLSVIPTKAYSLS